MMNSQRSDAEKVNLIEEGKKWVLILKNNENIKPRVSKTSNGRTMLLSKCAISDSKKSRFIKSQEAKRLLSNLGVRAPLKEVPILADILF